MLASCSILLLALSQHINAKNDFQSVHPSIGVSCVDPSYSAGYFSNSEGDPTVWAAKRIYSEQYTSSYIELGAAVGYKDYPVVPVIRAGYSTKYVEFFAMPGVETWDDKRRPILIIGMQFKVPYKKKEGD